MRITKQHVVSVITLTALLLAAGADGWQPRALGTCRAPNTGRDACKNCQRSGHRSWKLTAPWSWEESTHSEVTG